MASKPYAVLMTTLVVVLAGLAVWQFYTLMWGGPPLIGALPSR